MASIKETSVRNEIESLKTQFNDLCSKNKVPPETLVLMKSMFTIIEFIVSIFMEKITKKTSKNSSKPSSQTEKDETAKNNTNGKGCKDNSGTCSNTRTVESVTIAPVDFCEVCGEELKNHICKKHERRTKIDIVFEKVVAHVDAEIKKCPNCKTINKGIFSEDMSGPLQYGNGIKAYMLTLLITQMVALNRIQKSVKTLIGISISEATILKYVLQLNQALETWEQKAIAALLKRSSMNVDETSMSVDKKNN